MSPNMKNITKSDFLFFNLFFSISICAIIYDISNKELNDIVYSLSNLKFLQQILKKNRARLTAPFHFQTINHYTI